jgi:hypothetical protein
VSTGGLVRATTDVAGDLHQAAASDTPTTWYFAEGYTGAGFDEYLTILNPNDGPAAVTLTYYLSDSAPRTKSLTVQGRTRATVAVHEASLGVGRDHEAAVVATTTHPGGIVVERPIYFTYGQGVDGGHNALGASETDLLWYFAEGYTGAGFDAYLALLNPNAGPAGVLITFYFADGSTTDRAVTVPGAARATVAVHDATAGVGRRREVAARVVTTNPGGIVVERPTYFTYGAGVTGGHTVVGYAP